MRKPMMMLAVFLLMGCEPQQSGPAAASPTAPRQMNSGSLQTPAMVREPTFAEMQQALADRLASIQDMSRRAGGMSGNAEALETLTGVQSMKFEIVESGACMRVGPSDFLCTVRLRESIGGDNLAGALLGALAGGTSFESIQQCRFRSLGERWTFVACGN